MQYAYENSLFLAASKDFREAGTSRLFAVLQVSVSRDFATTFRKFASAKLTRYAFLLAKRLKEQGRTQEAEDLLRWAVDGLHAELGEHKIATRQPSNCFGMPNDFF